MLVVGKLGWGVEFALFFAILEELDDLGVYLGAVVVGGLAVEVVVVCDLGAADFGRGWMGGLLP